MTLLQQLFHNRIKHFINRHFHDLSTEAIDGPEIGAVHLTQPHEVDILSQCFGDLPGCKDPLGIGVHNHFYQHFRVIGVGPDSFVLPDERLDIYALYDLIHHSYQVPGGD